MKSARGPVSRVLSRGRYPCGRTHEGSHSSRRRIAPPLQQPTRASRGETPLPCGSRPLFGLAPGGVCLASLVTNAPVRSYRTLSPMPVPFRGHRRYTLCGTFPGLAPGGGYPPPSFRGARTFLGVASYDAAARPPGGAYLVRPWSRSKSNWNRIARTSPSMSPSMRSGRQRRWNASTAFLPALISYPNRSSAR